MSSYTGSTEAPLTYEKSSVPSPKNFNISHVAARRPAVLRACLAELELGFLEEITPELCNKLAGESTVEISISAPSTKPGNPNSNSFRPSDSVLKTMKFEEFHNLLMAGNSSSESTAYYLTTQQIPLSATGRPALSSVPCTQLLSHFKMNPYVAPPLLGDLIPVNYNLWLGTAQKAKTKKAKTNSGLHHDYHDNLYVLLEGYKKFVIFPPTASYCDGVDTIRRVHANGRIVHKEQEEEDEWLGAIDELGVRDGVRRLNELDKVKEGIEKRIEEGDEEAEEEFDDILDEILMLESGGGGNEEYFSGDEDDGEETEERAEKRAKVEEKPRMDPPNFSTKPMPEGAFEIELQAGDCLFLPAGWYHQVQSGAAEGKSNKGYHAAFNFWFHPPSSDGTFGNSYGMNGFWKEEMEARIKENVHA
ncbi:hypothetical protein TrST_g2807 [Triparma strigata]|uniref:JmjC domain-containing protein n=1 Tax=Triparma strigata TaxID=1606541 RepID=A0A9W7AXX8_9STRA|nr:hypothetical protein TrST_g2807 [Triparma strigata]